jgi:hypothetical protein
MVVVISVRRQLINLFSPEASMIEPDQFITPRNGYAMSYRDFVPHLMNVLDQLGMSLYARSNFMAYVSFFPLSRILT